MGVRPGPAGFHSNVLQLLPRSQKFTSQPKPNSKKEQTSTAGVLASLHRSAFPRLLFYVHRAGRLPPTPVTSPAGSPLGLPWRRLRGARSPERSFGVDPNGITEPCFCFSSLLGKIDRGDVSESPVLDTGSCMLLFCEPVSLQA